MAVAEALKHLRKATTDNERIAALLLVAKVVRSGEVGQEERRKVFDAVGFSFINRLLNTATIPEGCSVSPSHSIAVTLLACFVTDPQLATHSQVTSKIPLLLTFIECDAASAPDRLVLQEDSLQVLLVLTSSPVGLHHLLAGGCPRAAVRAALAGGPHRKAAEHLLQCVLGQAPVVSRHREAATAAMAALAAEFRGTHEQVKFELCNTLYNILCTAGEAVLQGDCPWLSDVAVALRDIISSRTTVSQRQLALLLSAQICQLAGVEWTLTFGNTTFFRLLASLAAVEVQLCVEGQELEAVRAHTHLLSACFLLLEHSVTFTASQTDVTEGKKVLSEEDQLQLHMAFTEAFTAVARFMNTLSSDPPPTPSHPHYTLILASVRVLGVWLAEESLALATELHQLLPFLVRLCDCHLRHLQTSSGAEDKGEEEEGGEEREWVLQNPLKFLLPGLSHLTAEEGPRAILLQAQCHALLLSYMSRLSGGGRAALRPEALPLFTLSCEVLLNVCICEAGVRGQEVFTHVAALLSRHMVRGSTNNRLELQAALLWLMVARQQGLERVTSHCSDVPWATVWNEVARLLLTGLKLSPAINMPDEQQLPPATSSSSSSGAHCEGWEEVAELWHLVMREATVMATAIPEIKKFLQSNDWMHQLSLLSDATHSGGGPEVAAVSQLLQALHSY